MSSSSSAPRDDGNGPAPPGPSPPTTFDTPPVLSGGDGGEGSIGGGSPVGVEDVDNPPHSSMTGHINVALDHDPGSLGEGEDSPAASAGSSPGSSESMGGGGSGLSPVGGGGGGGGRGGGGSRLGERDREEIGGRLDDFDPLDEDVDGSVDDGGRLGSLPMDMDARRPPVRGTIARPDLSIFERVRTGLAENSTVGWENAHVSIELATKFYELPESQRFLRDFLQQITGIMLDQHVSKIAPIERNCATRTLEMSCSVLPMLLQDKHLQFIETVVTLFDHTRTLYNTSKTMWNTMPGVPEQRVKLCGQFMSNGGFKVVGGLLEEQAHRLRRHAKLREDAMVTKEETARRAQLARAEAKQAKQQLELLMAGAVGAGGDSEDAPGGGGGELRNAEAALQKAMEAAVTTTAASEKASSTAATICSAAGEHWLGADSMAVILAAVAECRQDQPASGLATVVKICTAAMDQMKFLTDEELKKENQDALSLLVRHLRNLMVPLGETHMREVFNFHANLVLRNIRSASLPMRLWGWEQTEDLIALSHKHRWNAKAYLVEGAGTQCCNGIYRVSADVAENVPQTAYKSARPRNAMAKLGANVINIIDDEDAPKYTYRAKGGPLLTLFRCKMRTKAYWWFVSEADPAAPGTDKDVDYYQHKSNSSENFMPQRTGWEAATDNKPNIKGINPPPTVTPCEGVLCPPGQERKCLEWSLASWVVRNKVVEEIFGDSIHREVVGRSAKLLRFLSTMEGALTTEHLDLIWRSCVGKAEPELQAVVYQLLTSLVECMKPELVCHLIARLQESADGKSKGGGRHEVLAFVEVLAANQGQVILNRNRDVCSAALQLLWSLMREPSVVRHKACESVTNFFAVMLKTSAPRGSAGREAYWHQNNFLGQCIDFLREKANCTPPSGSLSEAEEAAVSRSLELVRFLLESFHPKHVGGVVQNYAFPRRTAKLLRQEQETKQQQPKREEQEGHEGQGEGEGTGQGRAREQASGESAAGDEQSPSNSAAATMSPRSSDVANTISAGENTGNAAGRMAPSSGALLGEGNDQPPSAAGAVRDAMVTEESGGLEGRSMPNSEASPEGGAGEKEAEQEGLPVLLLRELASFKARFSSRVGKHLRADAAEEVLKTQVRQRLDLIRYIHGLAREVNLSVAQLRGLWGILASPAERELCLGFLQEGASPQTPPMEHLHTAFGDEERVFLFRELICKDVDWTSLGMPAYSCFNAFFSTICIDSPAGSVAAGSDVGMAGAAPLSLPHPPIAEGFPLDGTSSVTPPLPPGITVDGDAAAAVPSAPPAPSPVEEEDLAELGIDTLWRVTLTSQNAEVAANATQDLLEVYNTPEMQRRTRASPANALERTCSGGSVKSASSSYGRIPLTGGAAAVGPSTTAMSGSVRDGSKKNRFSLSSFDSTSSVTDTSNPSTVVSSPVGHGQVFRDSIFSHLAEAREALEKLADAKRNASESSPKLREEKSGASVGMLTGAPSLTESTSTTAGKAEEAVRVRLRRCLGLLQGVIRGASGKMTPAHADRGMGLPWEVSMVIRVTQKPASHAGISSSSSSLSAVGSSAPISSTSLLAGGPSTVPPPLPPASRYILEVHPMETVGSLRVRVAIANGRGQSSDNTRLLAGGKQLSDDLRTCQEVNLTEGTAVVTLGSPNPLASGGGASQAVRAAADAEKRRAGPRHEGDVIAMQDEPFDELFRLLECAHGLQDHATTKAVLDLLMSLPTQCTLLGRVRETGIAAAGTLALDAADKKTTTTSGGPSAMDEEEHVDEAQSSAAETKLSEAFMATGTGASSAADGGTPKLGSAGVGDGAAVAAEAAGVVDMSQQWEELLPLGRNWHKTVYTLQIIDALLLPASEVLGAKQWSEDTDAFRMGFLHGGGFARVLQVLMAAPTSTPGGEDNRDAVLGHASALRILKTCLFYPPLIGVGRVAGGARPLRRRRASAGGGMGKVGDGGKGAEETPALVARPLPRMAEPTPAAREAMKVSDEDLQQLLDKLVLVSLAAQRRWLESKATFIAVNEDGNDSLARDREEKEEQAPYRQVITDCLAIVGAIIAEHPSMMKGLSENASAREFVVATLARNPAPRVRRQMGQLLVGARPMAGTLLRWLTGELENLPLTHTDCDEFFSAMRDLIAANHKRHPPALGHAPATLVIESSSTSSTTTNEKGGDASSASPEATPAALLPTASPTEVEGGGGDGEGLDLRALARVLSTKMMAMPRDGHGSCKAVLQGCLELLADLVEIEGPDGSLLDGTELGQDLVGKLFTGFLFTMPEKRGRGMSVERPVCAEKETKIAALDVLAAAARKSPRAMSTLLKNVDVFVGRVLPSLRHRWGYECSFDAKRNEQGRFVGLKNQGCTCYMNSLLQQLFMVPPLRKAILEAKLPRRKLEEWPKELVGRRVALQWETGGSVEAYVAGFNAQTGEHVIRYDMKEAICLRLGPKGGRPGKETGAVSLVWGDSSSRGGGEGKTMTQQEATALVLEEVQRTFVHLRDGERRFFDPIRLVEACRCLNLEYMVHQQNDASEFCDKLLDRLESGMKAGQAAAAAAARNGGVIVAGAGGLEGFLGGGDAGKAPRVAALDRLFGGTWVHQKIPTGCSHRTNRSEPFINLEVNIRGKESIEESLASFVESELMAGDNKVDCEDCGEKKDARLRTCLDRLPNLLIVHLKRFELDYTTFETVKLNDRCSFPIVLDVKPYTMKGTDEREAMEEALRAAGEAAGGDLTIEQVTRLHNEQAAKMEEDAGDYLYNLAGILVHAGVAQGGHYYSYIRDRGKNAYDDGDEGVDGAQGSKSNASDAGDNGSNGRGAGSGARAAGGVGVDAAERGVAESADGGKDAWYKFEDDEVTPFNPQDIEANCFGGTTLTTTTWNGVRNTIEHERTANALLLFYEKVQPREFPPEEDEKSAAGNGIGASNSSNNSSSTTVIATATLATEDSVDGEKENASVTETTPSSTSSSSVLPEPSVDTNLSGSTANGNKRVSESSSHADNMSTSTESDLEGGGEEKSGGALRKPLSVKAVEGGNRGMVIPLLDGVEAYSEEVWQANVQYMLNSYVFDSDFHKFLREILAATVGAMDGGSAGASVKGGAADSVNEWGNAPEEASLSARVLKMGMTQLLDVILHSREREDVKSWEALLRRALATSPEMCKWFLESLLERPRPEGTVYWLRQITLECLDNMARHTATRLIAHAACCGANDPVEKELLTAVDRVTGRTLHSGRRSRSSVARVLASVAELTEEVGAFPRSSEELFLLVRDLAMGHEAVRRHLLGSEMAARLAIFVTRDHSPPEVLNEFPRVTSQQSAHTDYVHLLEAVSAVLGAQRQPKADLLEEPTSSGGLTHSTSGHVLVSELTPLALNAFTEIFRRHSHNGGMDMRHMMDYMDSCGVAGKSKFESESTLKNILSKYDTVDGRLSLKGFISYYRDIAAQDPRQAWNDLYHMGYRSDLTAGPGYDDEVYGITSSVKGSQRRPVLPELTTNALTCIDFYLTAAHVSTGVSMGAEAETLILCRVAMDRPEESHRLISGCLQEIYHIRPAWPADDRQERVLCSVLLNLLRIRDEAQTTRIRHAFEDRPMGLLAATKNAFNGLNQHQRYNQYSPQAEKMWARYNKLWSAAHKIPAVKLWHETSEEAQAFYPDATRNARNRAAGVSQHPGVSVRQAVPHAVDSGEDSDFTSGSSCDLLVVGAGIQEVNGRYFRTNENADYPTFRQRTPVGKHPLRFLVFFNTTSRLWFIGKMLTEHHRTLAEPSVRMYYEAEPILRATSLADVQPPAMEWRPCNDGPAKDTRAPTVYFDNSMETDDDNSDNDLSTDNNQAIQSVVGAGDDLMDTGGSSSQNVLVSPARDGTDALIARECVDGVQLEMQDLPRGNSIMSTPSSSPTSSGRQVPPTGAPRSRGRARHASGPRTGSGGGDGGGSSSAAI